MINPLISVVIPVYKEEKSIRPFLERVVPVLEKIGRYQILFCLDPCSDRTESVIREEIAKNPSISLLLFSRRFGQPTAMMAGIRECSGDTCLLSDVDLQDPPELIPQMYQKLQEGYDMVAARRLSRTGETLIKKLSSWLGYRLINAIAEVEIPNNVGDFRIMNRKIINELSKLKENHGFFRGLVPLVGFRQTYLNYEREERKHGERHYNRFFGSFKIGLNGIIGFSTFPLTFILFMGLGIALFAFLAIFYIVVTKLFLHMDYPMGVPTISISMFFIGGVQLIAIGVLGEYIGRIYNEVRERPPYIIDQAVNVGKRQ